MWKTIPSEGPEKRNNECTCWLALEHDPIP